ncbi:ABC transporter permease [Patescibacteria group bacterium]|nr:ABC transporter permease [Patescibacteria group bacterium]
MMPFGASIEIALKTLKTNKARTFLTLLGVVIGICAVIVVVSAGNGLEQYITSQVEAFGTDTIEIEIKTPNTEQASAENATGMVGGISVTTLKIEDAEAVIEHPNISNAWYGVMSQNLLSYQGEVKKAFLMGLNAAFKEIDKWEVADGRFFTDEEDKSLSRVVILGSKVKDKLFGDSDAVGQNIKISRLNFRVIGVMEERGSMMFFDWDDMAIVPARTMQKKMMGIDHVSFIFAQMIDTSIGDQTVEDITMLLRERHGTTDMKNDDFAVMSMEQANEMMAVVFDGLTILLLALVSISLVVGGVGIMNIMYVSVTERTGEIGLRKAMGARGRDIMGQFLWESLIISFVAGGVGIVVGNAISYLIAWVASTQGFAWDFQVSIFGILLAVGFSAVVGLIFGLYPARKAASLDPIESLRFE